MYRSSDPTRRATWPALLALAALPWLLLVAGCSEKDALPDPSSLAPATSSPASSAGSAEEDSLRGDATSSAATSSRTWALQITDTSWQVMDRESAAISLEAPLDARGVRLGFRSPPVRAVAGQFRISFEGAARPRWTAPAGPAEILPGPRWGEVSGTDAATPPAPSSGAATDADPDLFFSLRWPMEDDEHGSGEVVLRFSLTAREGLSIRSASHFPESNEERVVELLFDCEDPDEAFFGLGTQVTGMNLRGRTFPLVVQEQGIGKPETGGVLGIANIPEAAYAPMGIWHSSRGYSAIVEHDSIFEIGLCSRESTEGPVSFLRSWPLAPALTLVNGRNPRERLFEITEYTGRIESVPPWVFSLWKSAVGGPEEMTLVEQTLRRKRIPASAIWTEDWIGAEPNVTGFRLSYRWSWDPQTYPNLPEDIAQLNERGFAVLGYFNPFIPQTVPTWETARDLGYLIQTEDGEPYVFSDPAFRRASMIDLNNPDAVAWLRGFLREAVEEVGLSGWMADFAEWLPLDSVPADGEHPWIAHQRYPLRWQQIHREELAAATADRPDRDARDWVFFARSGWASTQGAMAGIAPALWGGDQNTDWKYDDGYPTVIPIGTHAGLAGVGIFGSDISGYASFVNDPSDKELFFRWTTLGALSPLMRTHHGSSKCDNWRFDRDAETLAHFGRWARIHSLLYPYLDARLQESRTQGLPIMRHPWLVAPSDTHLWEGLDYQYFLGDDLLIAPVLRAGESTRTLRVPSGEWRPLFAHEEVFVGPGEMQVDAPLTELPILVRAGVSIPLLATEVDTFFSGAVASEGLRRLEDHPERLLALYPDAAGRVHPHRHVGVEVEGEGLSPSPNLEAFRLAGAPLADCVESGGASACILEGTRIVLRREAFTGEDKTIALQVGTGVLRISPQEEDPPGDEIHIAFGADAWGALSEATPVGELRPDLPPLCPEDNEAEESAANMSGDTPAPPREE